MSQDYRSGLASPSRNLKVICGHQRRRRHLPASQTFSILGIVSTCRNGSF
jgi:hypothetical protein